MSSRAAFWLLFVAASAATFVFASQSGVTAVTNDEVSYVALARLFTSGEPWARHLATFPPLFPLVLAATGSAHDMARAHWVVAAFAVAALPLIYRFAWQVLGRGEAALGVVLGFLLAPATWLAAKQLGAEPAFLAASLGALVYFEARGASGPRERWILGALLAAAVLARTAGFALVAAFAVRMAIRALADRKPPPAADAMALALPVAAAAAWIVLRPLEGRDIYALNAGGFAQRWMEAPGTMLLQSGEVLARGWVAAFALDSTLSGPAAAALCAFAILCLAGTWLRLRRNRPDGWYVVFSIAMLAPVFFGEQTARRYLYPLLPVLLVHAGVALAALAPRLPGNARAATVAAAIALPAAIAAASLATVAQRAGDGTVVLEGFPIRYSEMMDYYTARDDGQARQRAAANAGVLAGFDAIDRVTPRGARVMWMRPEYISILARRAADPWFYSDDAVRLAKRIEANGVDYVALSGIVKIDLEARQGDQAVIEAALAHFALPVVEIPNAVSGRPEFFLFKVDHAAVRSYLASRG